MIPSNISINYTPPTHILRPEASTRGVLLKLLKAETLLFGILLLTIQKIYTSILNTTIDYILSFFPSEFSFTDTDNLQGSRGREGTIFYSTLPLPSAHEHSDIYLQLCMWDDYHIFLIATLVFTRLLLDEIYHLIELLFDWLMMWCILLFSCVLILF